MKTIIINKDDVIDNGFEEEVRVKALLINSKEEIMLGYAHNVYQFPGGHVENNEELITTLNREITEETGISLNIENNKPFLKLIHYFKGYNKKYVIYYFEVFTDEEPILELRKLTKEEKRGNFITKYIELSKVEEEINLNAKKYPHAKVIAEEMDMVFKNYKESKYIPN